MVVGFWGLETFFSRFCHILVPRASYKDEKNTRHTRSPRRIDPRIAAAPCDFLYGASRCFLSIGELATGLRRIFWKTDHVFLSIGELATGLLRIFLESRLCFFGHW